MDELEKLFDEFPEVPRTIILKAELLRHGIRRTPVLWEIGQWALPESHWLFDWDREEHLADDVRANIHVIPELIEFNDGTIVKVVLDEDSPYRIEKVENKYMLLGRGKEVEEIFFPPAPEFYSKRCSDGTLMTSIAAMKGMDSFSVCLLNYCEYFKTGDQCRFCNMNPGGQAVRKSGRDYKISKPIHLVAEVAREAYKEGLPRHAAISGGGLLSAAVEAERYAEAIRAIKEAIGLRRDTIYGEAVTTAFDDENAKKLYDSGIESVCWNIEVWDPKLFQITCPGKAKYVGREEWMKRLLNAVKNYWGEGKVQTNVVAGVEMAQPYGFKTADEALESTLGGFEWLTSKGIVPRYNHWSTNVGSPYADKKKEIPPTEYYIRLGIGRHELMKKYGLFPHGAMMMNCYRDHHRGIFQDFYHLC